MIHEDLVAERIAIDSYRQMIEYIEAADSTTRRVLEKVTARERNMQRILPVFLSDTQGQA